MQQNQECGTEGFAAAPCGKGEEGRVNVVITGQTGNSCKISTLDGAKELKSSWMMRYLKLNSKAPSAFILVEDQTQEESLQIQNQASIISAGRMNGRKC